MTDHPRDRILQILPSLGMGVCWIICVLGTSWATPALYFDVQRPALAGFIALIFVLLFLAVLFVTRGSRKGLAIRSVDLFLTHWGSPWIAHAIVSFQIADGNYLAMLIEGRKTALSGAYTFQPGRLIRKVAVDWKKSASTVFASRARSASSRAAVINSSQRSRADGSTAKGT